MEKTDAKNKSEHEANEFLPKTSKHCDDDCIIHLTAELDEVLSDLETVNGGLLALGSNELLINLIKGRATKIRGSLERYGYFPHERFEG